MNKLSRILRKIAGILGLLFAGLYVSALFFKEQAVELKFFGYSLMMVALVLAIVSLILDKRSSWIDKKRKRDSLPMN